MGSIESRGIIELPPLTNSICERIGHLYIIGNYIIEFINALPKIIIAAGAYFIRYTSPLLSVTKILKYQWHACLVYSTKVPNNPMPIWRLYGREEDWYNFIDRTLTYEQPSLSLSSREGPILQERERERDGDKSRI